MNAPASNEKRGRGRPRKPLPKLAEVISLAGYVKKEKDEYAETWEAFFATLDRAETITEAATHNQAAAVLAELERLNGEIILGEDSFTALDLFKVGTVTTKWNLLVNHVPRLYRATGRVHEILRAKTPLAHVIDLASARKAVRAAVARTSKAGAP